MACLEMLYDMSSRYIKIPTWKLGQFNLVCDLWGKLSNLPEVLTASVLVAYKFYGKSCKLNLKV